MTLKKYPIFFSFPFILKLQELTYSSIITLVSSQKLLISQRLGLENLPGIVFFTLYINRKMLFLYTCNALALLSSSTIRLILDQIKSGFTDTNIIDSIEFVYQLLPSILVVYKLVLSLLLSVSDFQILTIQQSVFHISNTANLSCPTIQSWATPRDPSLPYVDRTCID